MFISPCKSMFRNHLVGLFNPTSLTFNKIPTHVFYLTVIDLFLITSFQILLQNWMAFTNLRVDNFTITSSLVFTNTNSPSPQDNYAFCQVRIKSASFLHLYPYKNSLFCTTTTLIILFHLILQTINFTETFYAPPVVLVTPRRSDNNNNSNLSGSRCNAVTTWVEVRNTRKLGTAS